MFFVIPTLFISSINRSIDQAITEHYQKPLSFIIHITHIPSHHPFHHLERPSTPKLNSLLPPPQPHILPIPTVPINQTHSLFSPFHLPPSTFHLPLFTPPPSPFHLNTHNRNTINPSSTPYLPPPKSPSYPHPFPPLIPTLPSHTLPPLPLRTILHQPMSQTSALSRRTRWELAGVREAGDRGGGGGGRGGLVERGKAGSRRNAPERGHVPPLEKT